MKVDKLPDDDLGAAIMMLVGVLVFLRMVT